MVVIKSDHAWWHYVVNGVFEYALNRKPWGLAWFFHLNANARGNRREPAQRVCVRLTEMLGDSDAHT